MSASANQPTDHGDSIKQDPFFVELRKELDEVRSQRSRRQIELSKIRSESHRSSALDSVMSRLSILRNETEIKQDEDTRRKREERHKALVERYNLILPDVLLSFVDIDVSLEENFQFVLDQYSEENQSEESKSSVDQPDQEFLDYYQSESRKIN